jgi:pre-mRNA-splicing factor ATP-dependent RNA helicase DHX16
VRPLPTPSSPAHGPAASKAKTPSALAADLATIGLPDSVESRLFATELYGRIPRAASVANKQASAKEARRRAEEDKKKLGKQRFALMLDERATDPLPPSAVAGSSTSRDRKEDRKGKSRARADDGWDSDEEERELKRRRIAERNLANLVKADAAHADVNDDDLGDEDTFEDAAAEAERDRKERDEFAARMRERDKGDRGRRKIVEDTEAKKRQAIVDDPANMPSLRLHSRREYLGKREQQQLDLLRLDIADFEADARGQRLTDREYRELEHKKQLLKLAEERLGIDEGLDGYGALGTPSLETSG